MSVMIVGLSYRTAPISLLERAALDESACRDLERSLLGRGHIAEAVVLSTCNRLEIHVDASRFHGGMTDVGTALSEATGVDLQELTEHLFAHYEDAAVAHLFDVACGLDSMALGEQQILGQVRHAHRAAVESGTCGRVLDGLFQRALRAGKRAHSETGLDRAGHSLVASGLDLAEKEIGPLSEARALVVGAGVMSGLVVASLIRAGVAPERLTIVNRTPERARRLADGSGGTAAPLSLLPELLGSADLVLSCTGALGHVLTADTVEEATRVRRSRPQAYVDLALPRDVDPAAKNIDGVTVIDLERLGEHLADEPVGAELELVRELIAAEVRDYLAARRAEAVAPTVVALRAMANSVVEAELARLDGRLGIVDEQVRAELRQTVHRVVEKLLHTPTVRVKELAGEPGGSMYADALGRLFGLAPERIAAVSLIGADASVDLRTTAGQIVNARGGTA
jgi:glutamyl-tRNA reductase